MKAIAIIPARYASTRFPGKPLLKETGKFLIQHVYEQVSRCRTLTSVVVATDDARIHEAVASFGGMAVMTREDHPTGTDRVAEAAATTDADLIVNVQGDEPEIAPENIDRLVDIMRDDPATPIGTLACPFPSDGDPKNPNGVKVVISQTGRALYFSRSLIPYPREAKGAPDNPSNWLLHLGLYAYRREFLFKLAKLAPTPLEEREKLEQLRVLEHGYSMAVAVVSRATGGVDTPEDYAAFVARWRRDHP